jgi:hypothetical protein
MKGGSSIPMVSRRTYRKPVPRGPRRYLRPGPASMWQPIRRTSTHELAERPAGIDQIEDAVTHSDAADFGRRIDEPALRRHVRDRDQLGARTDRAIERGEGVVVGGVTPRPRQYVVVASWRGTIAILRCSTWPSTASSGVRLGRAENRRRVDRRKSSGSSDGDPEEDRPAGSVRDHRANPRRCRRLVVRRWCKTGPVPLPEPPA